MSGLSRSLFLASVSALALACPALAQDAAAPADDSVFVLGDITLTVDDVAGYFANGAQATKSAVPISEAQQSISVVTNEQITEQGAENLGEALNYTAGVLGQPFGTDPRFNNPTFRGFTAESAQYVNGLRQFRYFGAIAQETYGMQQVEVLRGPSSSLYGAGSPAGIINQVQKRAQSSDFGEVGLGHDSNGSAQAFFDMNRAASPDLSWRLTGIARDSQGQIEDLTNKGGYLAGAVRWTPGEATTIDFLANHTNDAPLSPTGIPLALVQTGYDEQLRDLYAGQKNWDDSDRRMWSIGTEVSHELEAGWTLSQGFRYQELDWDYRGTYALAVTSDSTFGRGSSIQSEQSNTISLDTRLSGEIFTGQATHQLLFGADVLKYEADEFSAFGTGTDIDWRNPDYNGALPDLQPAPSGGTIFKQYGLYAQDEISFGNWRGSLGLRYDWVEQSGEQYTVPTNFDDTALTGRAGLSYVMANGVMPYISYSTSFDPQTGSTPEGDLLRPSEGKQWEAGVKYHPAAFDGLITAAVYDLRQTNVKYAVGSNVYRQFGKVKSRGFELEATVEIAGGWDIRGAYAYNDTEQVAPEGDATNGKSLINAPQHLASLWLDRDFANGLRLGGGVRHIGTRFGDNANTIEIDSATLIDVGASYNRGNIEAQLNINNLADEVYVATCSAFGCYYGEGRSVAAKVSYKW